MGRVQVRKCTYRGVAGHSIVGTDNLGRRVSIFTPYGEGHARRLATAAKIGDHDGITRLLLEDHDG
jgi:hypothetical protein